MMQPKKKKSERKRNKKKKEPFGFEIVDCFQELIICLSPVLKTFSPQCPDIQLYLTLPESLLNKTKKKRALIYDHVYLKH